jgi:anthranilate phosphoribosyltransferase
MEAGDVLVLGRFVLVGGIKGKMLRDLTLQVPERELTRQEVVAAMSILLDASADTEAKAAFLRAWTQRGESAAELAASAETLLPRAVDPGLRGSWNDRPLLDCCGTGGGGLNLLNVSTGIVFILAAMGVPVVKHGNRGVTKKSGSADVLEALGIKIDLKPDQVKACLEKVGAVFLFAPAYHTTFAAIAPVRQKLAAEGRRTIFNLLGPLLNPARPDARLVGVFKWEHVELYAEALEKMKCLRFTVACGEDEDTKIGEVSARGVTQIHGTLRSNGAPLDRLERNFPKTESLEKLFVRDAGESAGRLRDLFSNTEQGLARETLLVNAALAAWTQGAAGSFEEGYDHAREILDSERALGVLQKWQEFSAKV